MAISTPTNRGSSFLAGAGASITRVSNTFAPTAGALLVMLVYAADKNTSSTATCTPTDTFGGTSTWRKRVGFSRTDLAFTQYKEHLEIWVATAGGSPASGAITGTFATLTGADSWLACHFLEIVSGFDTAVAAASPTGATGSGGTANTTATTLVTTMSATPDTNSLVLGAHGVWDKTSALSGGPTSWTQNVDTYDGTFLAEIRSAYRNTGANQATYTWTTSAAASSIAGVLEIPPSAAATFVAPTIVVPVGAVNRASRW